MTDGERPRSDIDAKLLDVARQYDALNVELSKPEVASDPDQLRRLGKELSQLEPVVEAFRRLEATRHELDGAREMREAEADGELRDMARDEVDRLSADETAQIES